MREPVLRGANISMATQPLAVTATETVGVPLPRLMALTGMIATAIPGILSVAESHKIELVLASAKQPKQHILCLLLV